MAIFQAHKKQTQAMLFASVCVLALPSPLYAAAMPPLPGAADASRINQRETVPPVTRDLLPPEALSPPTAVPTAPPSSREVVIQIDAVHVDGMTAFTPLAVQDIWAPYLGRKITLDSVWAMAEQLTQRYRAAGYFLSRVIVPEQEIKGGTITLRAIEGYIGDVKLDSAVAGNRVARQWVERLKADHPLRADYIESVLLQLNDLAGVNLHAVLEPMQDDTKSAAENSAVDPAAVRLVLENRRAPYVTGSVTIDNNGSRYLGPYETQVQAQVVVLPGQKTTFTGFGSLPWDEIKYGGIQHEIALFPRATLELYGSYTHAAPGYKLTAEDIRSNSTALGAAFDYSLIRQRDENLTARAALDVQNAESNILGTPLTRDYVRALRLALNYQLGDIWDGQNALNATLSQGLAMLGASPAGQLDISRAGARPDFTKMVMVASRLQSIGENWGLLTSATGQIASGPLYSSEQFGYGGQAFGRAYDNSFITGDQGAAASAELRYSGVPAYFHLQPIPYVFYDLGAVWNLGSATTMPYATGSSAGIGFRLLTDLGASANFGLAFPLTARQQAPLTGNGKNPRYFFDLSYGF